MNLDAIPAFDEDGIFHLVVESPRGSNLKLKYEREWNAMSISRPLPLGISYPFDWGFIPSTLAADGDPLDAMAIWDVPSYPGVVLRCRAIGVVYVEQNRVKEDRSNRIHNDRVLTMPIEARREQRVSEASELPLRVRQELERFFLAAAALEGKDAEVTGWGDAATAVALVRSAAASSVTLTR
jgi:inorganic pyrophosphatase